jgi:hypothetical protein
MDNLALVIALSSATNRVVEYIKPLIGKLGLDEEWRVFVLHIIQGLAGIGGAALIQFNALADLPIPPLAGILVTGFVSALGADGINAAFGWFYWWKNKETVVAISGPEYEVTVEVDDEEAQG